MLTSCIIEMLEEEKNLKFIVTVDVTKIFSLLHLLVTVFRSFGSLTKIDIKLKKKITLSKKDSSNTVCLLISPT